MTTKEALSGENIEKLNENMAKIEVLSQRLIAAVAKKKPVDASLQGPGQELFMKAATAYMSEMMSNPSKMFEDQVSYWGHALKNYIDVQQSMVSGEMEEAKAPASADKRFSSPLWESKPYFRFIKEQYLLNANAVEKAVSELDGLDAKERKRIAYFTQQIVDMMSPTNFLATNPEALQRAAETEGQSLVDGLENLVRDIEANNGEVITSLADKSAFTVGENLATTEGSVVFRNRMFELIQYAPTTAQVHEIPLLIFPPWINKFYILDLKPQNSLISWLVGQGYTVFVVSWVNPDPSYADVGMGDYIEEGYLTAIETVKEIAGQPKINVTGYCIAGTTLALTLALMKKRKNTSVNSATFFTTLTDFADQGEVGVFLNDDFLDGIEREVNEVGILRSYFMSRTFSYLRSNDLIYQPAIRSYMMGQTPPAFDLLFWNGDGTNLPAKMSVEYLRGLCQRNDFATGGMQLLGETLSLKEVSVPVCAIACETDHIAAWKSSYDGIRGMGSKDKTFILSQSGHIAGIINPPSKKKYGHYTHLDVKVDHDAWRAEADFNEGSWWPRWDAWLVQRSGQQIPARKPGDSKHPILCAAPGTYVVSEPTPQN